MWWDSRSPPSKCLMVSRRTPINWNCSIAFLVSFIFFNFVSAGNGVQSWTWLGQMFGLQKIWMQLAISHWLLWRIFANVTSCDLWKVTTESKIKGEFLLKQVTYLVFSNYLVTNPVMFADKGWFMFYARILGSITWVSVYVTEIFYFGYSQ